jgi:hypothetical protein
MSGETQDVTQPVLIAITALRGAIFWRQNQGTFRTMDGRRVVSATSITGVADILGAYRARPVAIETKTRTGTLRKTQKTFRENWIKAGGIYIIARSPEEALLALGAIA